MQIPSECCGAPMAFGNVIGVEVKDRHQTTLSFPESRLATLSKEFFRADRRVPAAENPSHAHAAASVAYGTGTVSPPRAVACGEWSLRMPTSPENACLWEVPLRVTAPTASGVRLSFMDHPPPSSAAGRGRVCGWLVNAVVADHSGL